MLVSFADANLASIARADGGDILFTASDGVTRLSHEVERYTTAGGRLAAWISVPALAAGGDTLLYIYYGNPSAPAPPAPAAAWDTAYRGVWAFAGPNSLNLADSTANHNDGAPIGAPTAAAGRIGGALAFSGTLRPSTSATMPA